MKHLINKLFYAAYRKELCGLAKEARLVTESRSLFFAGRTDGIIMALEKLDLIK